MKFVSHLLSAEDLKADRLVDQHTYVYWTFT